MKNTTKATLFLCLGMLYFSTGKAQNVGLSFSYSSIKVFSVDFFYKKNKDRFHIGYGYQFNGQKNTVVRERNPNYGLTKISDGDFFWLIDLGYSRIIAEKLTIHPEISFASKNYFTNYQDNRFSDNGYSLINRSETKVGIGVNAGYLISNKIEPFIGYHTIKKMNFGLRFSF